jgi:protein-tyrosine phosphatase
MPPVLIDIKNAEDGRDVVHRAVQALVEGQLVAFPTETSYGLAASALCEASAIRLLSLSRAMGGDPPTLVIKSAEEVGDYVPGISAVAQRLARRGWPGPLTLEVPDEHPESLLRRLPLTIHDWVAPEGKVRLRVPAQAVVIDVLRMLAGPLAMVSIRHAGHPAVTAQELVSAVGDQVQLVLDDGRSRLAQPESVVRVGASGLEVLREGVVSRQTVKRLSCFFVLFVCTGNTCRSPMAEGLCRQLLADRLKTRPETLEDHGVAIASAGVSAMTGGGASREAVMVLREMGIDLSAHESQPLTAQLVRNADVILTMTSSHRHAILSEWPEAAPRVALLCRDRRDVPDPIGGTMDDYLRCARAIRQELEARVNEWPV